MLLICADLSWWHLYTRLKPYVAISEHRAVEASRQKNKLWYSFCFLE